MADNKIYVGDVGTVLEVEAQDPSGSETIDLSTATTLRLDMIKPNGDTVNWTATAKSGDVSVAEYTVVASDLDVAGVWQGQIYAEWDASNKWRGSTFTLTVYALGK